MRIRLLSDLHLECSPWTPSDVKSDLVVLAGDIERGTRGVAWARTHFTNVPVLYVAGNHEHYGERIGRLHEKLRAAAGGSNVTILEGQQYQHDGIRFFGATMWTDFELFGDPSAAMTVAGRRGTGMADYVEIRREDTGRLMPKHTALLHAQSKLALLNFFESSDPSSSVIITHHAPSPRSLATGRDKDVLSAAYASELGALIGQYAPKMWIHGHIHEKRDYRIGATRILSNPRGYQTKIDPEVNGFCPDLVVEI